MPHRIWAGHSIWSHRDLGFVLMPTLASWVNLTKLLDFYESWSSRSQIRNNCWQVFILNFNYGVQHCNQIKEGEFLKSALAFLSVFFFGLSWQPFTFLAQSLFWHHLYLLQGKGRTLQRHFVLELGYGSTKKQIFVKLGYQELAKPTCL